MNASHKTGARNSHCGVITGSGIDLEVYRSSARPFPKLHKRKIYGIAAHSHSMKHVPNDEHLSWKPVPNVWRGLRRGAAGLFVVGLLSWVAWKLEQNLPAISFAHITRAPSADADKGIDEHVVAPLPAKLERDQPLAKGPVIRDVTTQ
jgi:hypothetical protein